MMVLGTEVTLTGEDYILKVNVCVSMFLCVCLCAVCMCMCVYMCASMRACVMCMHVCVSIRACVHVNICLSTHLVQD